MRDSIPPEGGAPSDGRRGVAGTERLSPPSEGTSEALILGVETSCDETAASVVGDGRRIFSNVVASQVALHAAFGGVVPEIAGRRHVELILPVVRESLEQAGITPGRLSAVAVTSGPGLVGSLLVGISAAKALAFAWRLPLVGVHHIEGHIYANFLEHHEARPPLVCLTASGGHTALFYLPEYGRYEVMGQTRDDAAGEALDKVAREAGLPYPGGPAIEEAARGGDPGAVPLPRPMLAKRSFDFSFSGLKTAALLALRASERGDAASYPEGVTRADFAAGLQEAVVDVLATKLVWAAEEKGVDTLFLAGGVAANRRLRERVREEAASRGWKSYAPPLSLCTDNAAMIAGAGYYAFAEGRLSGLDLQARPSGSPLGRMDGKGVTE